MSVLVAGNVLKMVAQQQGNRSEEKWKRLRATRRGVPGAAEPCLGKVDVCKVCRQAAQRKIGPTQATRHYSRSLSRPLHPREKDRGLMRLTKAARVPSPGKEAAWNSTLREKSIRRQLAHWQAVSRLKTET